MNLGPDGRPQHKSTEEMGFKKYSKAFRLLKKFVDGNLDYYKVSRPWRVGSSDTSN